MYFRYKWAIICIFIIVDIIVFWGVFYFSFHIRDMITSIIGRELLWRTQAPMALMGIILGIFTFFFMGLYPGYGLTAIKELERMSKATTLIFFLMAGASFLNKSFLEFSRSILFLAWIMAIILLPIMHFILRNLLSRSKYYGTPVIIFGEGTWAKNIEESLRAVRRLGWKIVKTLPLNSIETYEEKYDTHLIAVLAISSNSKVGSLPRNLSHFFRKVVLVQETDYYGSLWVSPLDLDGRLGLEFNYHLLEWHSRLLKLVFDTVVAFILLLLSSPLFFLISLLIKITSPGPAIFKQKRVGQNFQDLYVFKFRTMAQNAEQTLEEILLSDNSLQEEFNRFHKLENDPRITKIGKILRRYSFDELPQLWNVLKGEMSLVGPRAYLNSELEKMGSYAPIILRVKPSMTGWWQVTGHNKTSFQERLEMDEYYISNWSLWMDIYIMLKTVWIVIKGSGV
jgi:Undecaprenyl-phosphate galactose phosphotransferase WbaP